MSESEIQHVPRREGEEGFAGLQTHGDGQCADPQAVQHRSDLVGAAEAELGRYVYRRIEALMDAKPGTAEGAELTYLATIAEAVEEYGEENCGGSKLAPFPHLPGRDDIAKVICPHAFELRQGRLQPRQDRAANRETALERADAILALSSEEPAPRVGQGANAYTAEGKETRDEPSTSLPQPGGWRPIETAPKDGTDFLGCNARISAGPYICHWQDGHDSGSLDADVEDCEGWHGRDFYANPHWLSHWQPLPPVPTDGGGEGKQGLTVSVDESGVRPSARTASQRELELYSCEVRDLVEHLEMLPADRAGDSGWTVCMSAGHWRCVLSFIAEALNSIEEPPIGSAERQRAEDGLDRDTPINPTKGGEKP